MSKISMFGPIPREKGSNHHSEKNVEIDELLSAIKYGTWKTEVESIRAAQTKTEKSDLKRTLPSVTVSGIFAIRNQNQLVAHSGFICIDIDNYTDRTSLINDKYTHALFTSVGGNGMAVVVKINKEHHKASFNFLRSYYFESFGITVDSAPQNVASLRYVSFDPNLFLNEKSKVSSYKEIKQPKIKSLPIVLDGSVISDVIRSVNANIAHSYDEYLRLGFAICSGFGESGRAWFHQLASISEKYNQSHCDKQFDICLKGAHNSGVSVGTFYWMLKEAGATFPKTDTSFIRDVAIAKKSGRTQEGIVTQLVELRGVNPEQAKKYVDEVYNRDDLDLAAIASDPEKLIESVMAWLSVNHPIKRNVLTGQAEETGLPVNKSKLNSIYLRARATFNTPNVTFDLIDRIIESDFTEEFNPITEYINKNRHRSKDGQLSALVQTISSDTLNYHIFIRKWMLSLIAAYEGNPVRSVLSLVGGQGTGKTEWFRRILPKDLQKYYAESKLDAGKDDDLLMCQKLIVVDDEMGGKSKQDEKRFKELTSKQVFSLREAYGRGNQDYKRLAVLGGTSNDANIINDPTGNTRILPVNVLSIDHHLFNSIDKDELFMECYRRYKNGEDWYLTRDEFNSLSELTPEFEGIAFERELILSKFSATGFMERWLTATAIKNELEINSKQTIKNMKIFGAELKRIFGESTTKKIDGNPLKVYKVYDSKTLSSNYQEDVLF